MVMEGANALSWLRKQIETADADLLREMVTAFAEALMGADVRAERVNCSNGSGPSVGTDGLVPRGL